jgi:ABC-type multidrug transport system fused ATPase/permease subunit
MFVKRSLSILTTIEKVLALSPAPRWVLGLIVVLGLGAALADSLSTNLIVLLLYAMMGRLNDIVSGNGLFGSLLTWAVPSGSAALALVIFLLVIINVGLTFFYTMLTANTRYRVSESVRNLLCRQFLDISYDFILRYDQGELLNLWTGESWLMGDMYLYVGRLFINVCASIVFLIFLAIISWKLLIIAIVGTGVVFLAMHRLSAPARELGRKMRDEHEQIAERMLVILQGMRALRTFAREALYQHRFETASAQVRRTSLKFERLYALAAPSVQLGYLLLLVAIVFVGGPLGVSFVGTLAFVALLYRFQPYMRELQGNLLSIAQLQASVASVLGMLDRSDKTYINSGSTPFCGLRSKIRFDAVSFTYAGAPLPSLDRVDFTVPAGSVTALVGMSGAGKTTIVNLLLGLYRPSAGAILVDGVPIDGIRRTDWLSRVSAAGQDIDLIEGTVGDNLRVAQTDADLAAMRRAAKTARILETIESLPDGFDSWIGQQGLKLSGGQRQRLGLARALLRDPDILILDEASNALNSGLEAEILNAIRRQLNGRTLIIITHRLETAMSADQVVCLASGRVVESGSPAELRARPESLFWTLIAPDKQESPGTGSTIGMAGKPDHRDLRMGDRRSPDRR